MVTITEETLVLQAEDWSVGLTPLEKHFQLRRTIMPQKKKKNAAGVPQKKKKNVAGALTTQPHLALRLKNKYIYTSGLPLGLCGLY